MDGEGWWKSVQGRGNNLTRSHFCLSRALCVYICVGGLVGDGFQEFGLYVSYHHETFGQWPVHFRPHSPHWEIGASDNTTAHTRETSMQRPS